MAVEPIGPFAVSYSGSSPGSYSYTLEDFASLDINKAELSKSSS